MIFFSVSFSLFDTVLVLSVASIAFCRQNGKIRLLGDTPNTPEKGGIKNEKKKQQSYCTPYQCRKTAP